MSISNLNFPVPYFYSNANSSSFIQTKNLAGYDAKTLGYNANYLAANGFVAVPEFSLQPIVFSINQRAHYRFYLPIVPNNNTRYWNTKTSGAYGNYFYEITSSATSNITTITRSLSGYSYNLLTEQINYTSSFNSSSFDDVNFVLYYSGTTSTRTFNLGCFYAPTINLNPTTQRSEQAVDVLSLDQGKPIYATANNHNSSLIGIANTINYIPPKGLYGWFFHYKTNATTNANAFNSTTTAPVSLKSFGYNHPFVFATANNLTQTYKSCSYFAYVGVQSAGDVGQLQITSSLGNSAVSFSSTTPSWVSGTIVIPTENLALRELVNINSINGMTGNLDLNIKKTTSVTGNAAICWSFQIYENMT